MRVPRGYGKIERACQEGVERVASLTESAGGLLGVEGERVSLSSGRQVNGVNSDLSSVPVSLRSIRLADSGLQVALHRFSTKEKLMPLEIHCVSITLN